MTLIADGIDLGASDEERYRHLRRIIENVLADTDPAIDEARRRWIAWLFLYICWYEGSRATTRTQKGTGPARGFMQFEPQTLWDLIDIYVFGATPGLIRNLAAAAGVSEDEMREALLAFRRSPLPPTNVWPNPTPNDPAGKIERWLLDLDSFGIKLMRFQFRRESAHQFPPEDPADRAQDPQQDRFKGQFSEQWAKWWKRQFRGGAGELPDEERTRKKRDFEERARQLDRIAAGAGPPPETPTSPSPPSPPPPPAPTPAPPTTTPTSPPTTPPPPPPPSSCPFVHAFGALSAEVALGRKLRRVMVSRWSGRLVVGTYQAIRPLISRVISASPRALSVWRVLAGGAIETARLTLRK